MPVPVQPEPRVPKTDRDNRTNKEVIPRSDGGFRQRALRGSIPQEGKLAYGCSFWIWLLFTVLVAHPLSEPADSWSDCPSSLSLTADP